MGSDGFALSFHAMYSQNMNMHFTWDPSHGVHNNIVEAHRSAGLRVHDLMKLLALNVPHGPWAEDVRFQQCLDMLEDLLLHENELQPLFQELLPSMARDKEETHRLGEAKLAKEYWQELSAEKPFRKKGADVNSNRFLGTQHEGRGLVATWHRRLFVYQALC